MKDIQIIPIQTKDKNEIINIMKTLYEYFSPETIEFAEEKISNQSWLVAIKKNIIIWFISFEDIDKNKSKIYWMWVLPSYQGQWIGSILLKQTENLLQKQWIKEIELLTLDEHPDYPGYLFTRMFYKKHGFVIKRFYMEDDIKILTMIKTISK